MKMPIAYCGLACCLCSKNTACPGCQAGGCEERAWCKHYRCCRGKGLSGCWECADFPCAGGMLDKPRVRAFARFAGQYGTEELERCLMRNNAAGVVYHYDGQLRGDYDQFDSEEAIIHIIKGGQVTGN